VEEDYLLADLATPTMAVMIERFAVFFDFKILTFMHYNLAI